MITFFRGSDTVDMPEPRFGNPEPLSMNQMIGETEGGKTFVEDPGFETTRFTWEFNSIKDTERVAFEAFFRNIIQGSIYTFDVKWANPNKTFIKKTISSGMVVDSGTTLYSGMTLDAVTIYCGQTYAPDFVYYENLRLITGGSLPWQDARDGWWDLSLEMVKEPD